MRTPLEPAPGRANDWHALGLESGAYTVEITDPRFEPWRMEGVHTGRSERTRLVGSAALRFTVKPPDGAGENLETYGLRVTYTDVSFSPNTFIVAEDGAPAPQDGLFEGIVPGDLELEVRAPGQPPQFVAVPGLEPGETRAVSLVLDVARSLSGRVVHADGRPATGIPVQVTRGDVPGHDLEGSSSLTTNVMGPDGESRSVRVPYRDAETVSDAEGRFDFPGLTNGAYTLRAVASPWITVDAATSVGGDGAEPCLTLPELGSADVTLLLAEGASSEGIRVEPAPDSTRAHWQYGLTQAGSLLDEQGSCRLDGLPVGEQELRMSIEVKTSDSMSFHYVDLGSVLIEAGSRTSKTFDVQTKLPVSVTIETSFDGPVPDKFNPRLDVAEQGARPQGMVNMFSRGRSLHSAPPGRYHVRVACAPGGWRWTRPELLEVRPGEGVTVTVTVPLVERDVRVVDAAGRALAQTELTWFNEGLLDDIQRFYWARGPRWNDARAETDGSGALGKLALPPGTYHFARAGAEKEDTVEVSWEAGEGALEIALPDPR